MGLFDGYYDPDQFEASGGLPGRLMSVMRQHGILPDTDVGAPPSSAIPAPTGASLAWPAAGTTSFAPYLLASGSAPQAQAQLAPTQLAQRRTQPAQPQPQAQPAQFQQPQTPPQQPPNGSAQPDVGGPSIGDGPGGLHCGTE